MKWYKDFYVDFVIDTNNEPIWIIEYKSVIYLVPANTNSLNQAIQVVLKQISDKIKG